MQQLIIKKPMKGVLITVLLLCFAFFLWIEISYHYKMTKKRNASTNVGLSIIVGFFNSLFHTIVIGIFLTLLYGGIWLCYTILTLQKEGELQQWIEMFMYEIGTPPISSMYMYVLMIILTIYVYWSGIIIGGLAYVQKLAKKLETVESEISFQSPLHDLIKLSNVDIGKLWPKCFYAIPALVIIYMIYNAEFSSAITNIPPVQYKGNDTIFSQILQEVANTDAHVQSAQVSLQTDIKQAVGKLYDMIQIGFLFMFIMLTIVIYRTKKE